MDKELISGFLELGLGGAALLVVGVLFYYMMKTSNEKFKELTEMHYKERSEFREDIKLISETQVKAITAGAEKNEKVIKELADIIDSINRRDRV